MELVAFDVGDGTALTNTTTPTSILSASSKWTFPANFFNIVGKRIRFRAAGRISTLATTPGTLTLDFRLGSVVAFTSGALALNTTAKTNVTWTMEVELEARAVGASTTAALLGIGEFKSEAVIGSPAPSAGGSGVLLLPASAPANGTGFDSTAAQQLDMFGTWSVANASNSVQVHQFSLIALN
jgi:hypothetical protein